MEIVVCFLSVFPASYVNVEVPKFDVLSVADISLGGKSRSGFFRVFHWAIRRYEKFIKAVIP